MNHGMFSICGVRGSGSKGLQWLTACCGNSGLSAFSIRFFPLLPPPPSLPHIQRSLKQPLNQVNIDARSYERPALGAVQLHNIRANTAPTKTGHGAKALSLVPAMLSL